jgi:Uma2 family endonuclease
VRLIVFALLFNIKTKARVAAFIFPIFEAITNIPQAVIEVISKGYEAKDLDIAPQFYLAQGVKDVIVFDPMALTVLHLRKTGAKRYISPITIELEMGCVVTV